MDKKRCTNFTKDEIQILVDLVGKYKDVECKRTDCTSNAAKENQWRKIELEFNYVCGTGRTAKMLRSKWDSMKKTVKKNTPKSDKSLYKTGGGPQDEKILRNISNKILIIIGVTATGTESKFDSDFVEKSNMTTQSEPSNMALCDEDEISMDILALSEESPSCSWSSWNPQQLRTPTCRTLLLSLSLTTPSSATMSILTADCEAIAGPPNLSSDTKKEAVNSKMPKKTSNESSVKRKRFYKRELISAKIQRHQT